MTHSNRNPITWNTQRRRRGRFIVYCHVIPNQVLYTRHTYGEAPATAAAAAAAALKRKEEDVMV